MMDINRKELCYLSAEGEKLVQEVLSMGVEDLDLAIEIARKKLGDEKMYEIE